MKNRRNVLLAFLLCACLIVGIGYASLSTELFLTGDASISDTYMKELFDSKITWTSANSSNTDKVTAVITENGDKVVINASGLTTVGETIIIECEMTNASEDLNVKVTPAVLGITEHNPGDGEYFDIQVSDPSVETLTPNGSSTVIVTIKLLKSFVPDENSTQDFVQADFAITYTVTTVE